ncbi:TPA: hypothetical protein DCY43_00775 [candidate division WWE3 bacterium]|uniref:OmpR/PhoB-type domain-containing protein n=5 Tax=Katanobacteria TaxID=422282 RepID=A0A0G1NLE1_UNCKA|nr:MAG: hypothetical protein UW36_C0001G0057 [candidate division WWE3 bacterium GW2011_GWA2_44_16]KKT68450.1 MAG: hypothetical protein UW65_C0043G0006 [candidate division WWE3 bacterium GW2011_GWB1_44_4]KKT85039.1 MAG: hypothetical protein UW82_C0004G0045 [candidate division WWE3 bacterium GW2011_GWC2_44_9]OGC52270.1 MAG: hypothetical protein A2709_00280 [candidate division WWE3 bacterium RIFCSPHIGHO2_01_FULL_43_9]HAZ29275.1 hypothetical protein [candidate division WWE3 bacterium]
MLELEPEGLYPQYRQETTKQLASLMKNGQVFRLTAVSGAGESKYLRYISHSSKVFSTYFAQFVHNIIYTDLNSIYNSNTDKLISLLNESIRGYNRQQRSLEQWLADTTGSGKAVYFILDHLEALNDFNESAPRYLRSLRDRYKYKLGYILCYEHGVELDKHKLKQLLNISPFELILPSLNNVDCSRVLKDELKRNAIRLANKDRLAVLKACNGQGGIIRDMVVNIAMGKSLAESLKTINLGETRSEDTSGVTLQEAQRYLTKYEYLVFSKLHNNFDTITHKEDVAEILSPQSKGSGVSDESIDQIISRLRKKLADNNIPLMIKNKRGIGFYLTR